MAGSLGSLMIPLITKVLLALAILWFIGCAIFEIYMRIKESKYVRISRDVDPRKIMVSNDGYDVLEGCVAKINKLYVLGNNHTCEVIADGNWDYLFQWDDNSKSLDLGIGQYRVLNIYDINDEGIFLLFQNTKVPLPLYKDKVYGDLARKGTYQLEVVFLGNGKTGGGTDLIKKKTFWTIYYESNGNGKAPTFKMIEIKEMSNPTGKIDGEPFSNKIYFRSSSLR